MSKTSGILVGASLFAFVMFSSCGGAFGKGGSDSASIKEALDKAIADNKEIKVEDGGYKISIPNSMVEDTSLNDDASLEYKCLESNSTEGVTNEYYIIVIDESKTNYIKTFTDNGEYDDNLTPEKNYRMIQMKSMEDAMTMKGKPNVKKETINGLDAEVVDFTASVEGIDADIYYKLAFIEGTKKIYMVMTWTLSNKKSVNEDKLDQMIQSFKLIDAK